MLLSKEIIQIAADIQEEATGRPYVEKLMPEVVNDETFWRMLVEIFELALHRRGYVVVKREAVKDFA